MISSNDFPTKYSLKVLVSGGVIIDWIFKVNGKPTDIDCKIFDDDNSEDDNIDYCDQFYKGEK